MRLLVLLLTKEINMSREDAPRAREENDTKCKHKNTYWDYACSNDLPHCLDCGVILGIRAREEK